jgi:hypothetical protein
MESSAKELIRGAGKQGILLAELAQQIGEDEAVVLKLINSLSENGNLRKIEESHDGAKTIRVIWQEEEDSEWDTLQGCPCFICSDINQCGAGQPTNPWMCKKLDNWIQKPKD